MKIINGDITAIKNGVIIHQVNNRRAMGAGVAKTIRAIYPSHYYDYINSLMRLGEIVYSPINKNISIIGMISQNGWGRNPNIVYTDYEAFKECLYQIKEIHDKYPDTYYYMPYGIGCGLANGDWSVISKMIEHICPFIILVKYNK